MSSFSYNFSFMSPNWALGPVLIQTTLRGMFFIMTLSIDYYSERGLDLSLLLVSVKGERGLGLFLRFHVQLLLRLAFLFLLCSLLL